MEVRGVPVRGELVAEPDLRNQFRRDANKADNKSASAAVDTLMNYEAVKVTFPHLSVASKSH